MRKRRNLYNTIGITPRYRNGGTIHIKPENRGKFTETM